MAKTQAEVFTAPLRLKSHADFSRVRRGKIARSCGLLLQAMPRPQALLDARPRFGFTVSRRCGGAVARNRIRRRLKEALRLLKPLPAQPGHDYVIVARPEALKIAFPALQAALLQAFRRIITQKGNRAVSIVPSGTAGHGTVRPDPQESTGRTSKR